MENPEITELTDKLSTSTNDASDLIKGLLQASITAGLPADIDAHLGHAHSDHTAKAQLNTPRMAAITATGRTPKLWAPATAR